MDPTQRRQQILRCAADLFGEKGYHSTSISDIIRSAGIARGTFYLYFENKRALFQELVDDLLARLNEAIRVVDTSGGAKSAREQLLGNMLRVFDLLTDERPLLAILLESAVGLDRSFDEKLADFYESVAAAIESSLRLGQEMGLVRPCDTRIASLAVLGAIKELLHDLLRNRCRPEIEARDLAAALIDIFGKGVLAEGATIP